MLFDKNRQQPTPAARSTCPSCDTPLIAKCGEINMWHWAHESLIECDPWYEGISLWHINWQNQVKESCREVVVGKHRADIKLSNGKVFEIQRSIISVGDIAARESHYQDMAWIFDASAFQHNLHIKEKVSKYGNTYWSGRWKRPRRSILTCKIFPIYFDLGNEIFRINGFNKYHGSSGEWGGYTSYYAWGKMYVKDQFFYKLLFGEDYFPGT